MKFIYIFLFALLPLIAFSSPATARCPEWTTDALFSSSVYYVCYQPNLDRFLGRMSQQSKEAEPYSSQDVSERLSTILAYWTNTSQKLRILEDFAKREAFRQSIAPVFSRLADQQKLSQDAFDQETRLLRLKWNDTETAFAKELRFLLSHEQWTQAQLGPAFERRAEIEAFLISGSESKRQFLVDHYRMVRRRLSIYLSEIAMKPDLTSRPADIPLFLFTTAQSASSMAQVPGADFETKIRMQNLAEYRLQLSSLKFRDPKCEAGRTETIEKISLFLKAPQAKVASSVPESFAQIAKDLERSRSLTAAWSKSSVRLESLLDVLNIRSSATLDTYAEAYAERVLELPTSLRQEGSSLVWLIRLSQNFGELREDSSFQNLRRLPQQPLNGFSESLRRYLIDVIDRKPSASSLGKLDRALQTASAQANFDLDRIQKLNKAGSPEPVADQDPKATGRQLEETAQKLILQCP